MKNIKIKHVILYLILGFIIPILVGLISVNLGAALLLIYLISIPIFIVLFIRNKLKENKKKTNVAKPKTHIEKHEKVDTKKENIEKENKQSPKQISIYKRNLKDRKNKYNYTDRDLKNYIVIDTETTGLSAQRDHIIEISALKIKNGEIIENYTSLVNPGIMIPKSSIKIHGITDDMVIDAPTIDQVLPEFLNFIGNQPLIGHNLSFDLRFINSYLDKNINHNLSDTMLIARKKLGFLPNHKLITLIEYFELGESQEHRSLSDCIYTYKVYEKLKQE